MNQEYIDKGISLISEIIKENYPVLDIRPGTVNYDVLITVNSLGYSFLKELIDQFVNENVFSKIESDSANLDTSLIDARMENWFVTRKLGTKSNGIVKVSVNTKKEYSIPSGTQFISNDIIYQTTEQFTKTSSDLIQENTLWYFTIPISSLEIGSNKILKGNSFTTEIYGLNIQSVIAIEDFTVGSVDESNKDYLARVKEQLSYKDLTSRRSINKLLSDTFADIKDMEIFGYDDREMQRDANNVGIKTGGMIDVYYNTSKLYSSLIVETDSNGIFNISGIPILKFDKYHIVGNNTYYGINNFEIVSTNTNIDKKFVKNSIYEKYNIVTNFANSSLEVFYYYLPYCNDIQEYVSNVENRNLNANILIKTFHPCFLEFQLYYKGTIDEDLFKSTIINYIENYKDEDYVFYISRLIDEIHNFSGIEKIKLPLELTGNYYLPDGTKEQIKSGNLLSIDPDWYYGYSNKCFRYFTSSDLIDLRKWE